MAQLCSSILRHHPPMAENIPPITARLRQMLGVPYPPMTKNGGFHIHSLKQEGFVWREKLSPEQLDAAWNYVPREAEPQR